MKTYVLTVSRNFPKTHKRAGEPTRFKEQLTNGLAQLNGEDCKIHTIRSNYPLWAKRISEIKDGKAILSIRYWSGKPYNSKQVEICQLDKNSGIGVQELVLKPNCILSGSVELFSIDSNFHNPLNLGLLSKNDGLSFEDFKEWFRKYDLSQPMAIIHFTRFRY